MLRKFLASSYPIQKLFTLPSYSFAKFVRDNDHLNVCTIGNQYKFLEQYIGHITHGKTTLTSAITHYLSKKGIPKEY